MEKKYYVSDRIIGVIFTSVKQLERYYKRTTKISGLSCGNIHELNSKELNLFTQNFNTKCRWRTCTN
jgi:ribosomal protein S2